MNRTGVFQMIAQTVDFATDAQLRNALAFLARHNIAFALEAGPVVIPSGCIPSPGEGYGDLSRMQARVARIKALGGDLAYYAMDEPYSYVAYAASGHCRLSPQAAPGLPRASW